MPIKTIAVNKSASFEYFIEERYQAGIVLEGAEVKSLRAGKASLGESFCEIRGGEVFLKNMHIAVYDKSGAFSTRDSRRERKLLLNRMEINKIVGKVNERGYTLVPLKIYFKDALIKAEIALCKGKHTYDKKKAIAERDQKRVSVKNLITGEIFTESYDKLILSPGALPVVPSFCHGGERVFTLRTVEDAIKLKAFCKEKNVKIYN